jgi:hypothetical protein
VALASLFYSDEVASEIVRFSRVLPKRIARLLPWRGHAIGKAMSWNGKSRQLSKI